MTNLFEDIKILYAALRQKKWDEFKRHVSLGDLFTDRWETAAFLGFGSGSSCYDNVLVLGDVTVGKNSWIGPNVILDGRGGLEIGDFVTVCAGTQIYTHDSVEWSTSLGEAPLAVAPTRIGNGVFLGPQVIVQKGVTIGDKAVVGAASFVNKDVPAGAKAWGNPAQVKG